MNHTIRQSQLQSNAVIINYLTKLTAPFLSKKLIRSEATESQLLTDSPSVSIAQCNSNQVDKRDSGKGVVQSLSPENPLHPLLQSDCNASQWGNTSTWLKAEIKFPSKAKQWVHRPNANVATICPSWWPGIYCPTETCPHWTNHLFCTHVLPTSAVAKVRNFRFPCG